MDQLAAGNTDFRPIPPDQSLLGEFFSEFLDEAAFADFRQAERLVASLKSQGMTVAGYPIVRPADCGRITATLSGVFEASQPHFRTRDQTLTGRFEELIGDFHDFCQRIYPGEAMGARLLRARIRLFMGDAKGVLELVSYHAQRPYALEDNPGQFLQLIELFAQAHLQQGTLEDTNMSFIALGRWFAANVRRLSPVRAGTRMAPFVAFGRKEPEAPLRSAVIRWASQAYLDCLRGRRQPLSFVTTKLRSGLCQFFLGLCYRSLSGSGKTGDPFSLRRNDHGRVLVARAMGGIGDLLMMEPGLEANAIRYGLPVDFAVPRKFFPIFEQNPHVNLIDIDGPPIDISAYRRFFNLSQCPASRYESRRVPEIKKGRVETFAMGMQVNRQRLLKQGWKINHFLSTDDEAFCDDFLKRHGIGKAGGGKRPLVGVQPFSRDSYKDHPGIADIIRAIAKDNDVLIFHHVANGLPDGEGITTTAGLPLGHSLALVSRIEAMVSVDSAFLHAASAFDVPVVALFGPTDAHTLTRHHRRVKTLWRKDSFACVPCWRNEDKACAISGLRSVSPCMAAIRTDEVLSALAEMRQA
ncbi:MAG: glycosyltransferase family 9 protein [Pseudomonadota bacterium]|jgi:ADP-heptose:LPS heptosyltransferase|uniref:ADP-heptose--lipooligosaccharide heptosyltransferase II n=1 Tax=hydrothermal vent metagenome TaxID=652676 RepID=A0A160TKP6_9ZZZZ